MGKNVPLCTMLEDFLRDLRVHVDPEIARVVGQSRARELVRHLELNATRMAFHKSLLPLFPVKSVGKVSPDKLHDMKVSWMRWVVDQNPQLLVVCEKCGISIAEKVADKDEVWVCVCVCVCVGLCVIYPRINDIDVHICIVRTRVVRVDVYSYRCIEQTLVVHVQM